MTQKKNQQGWAGIVWTIILLVAAAIAIVILCLSKQCGGDSIEQAGVHLPTQETTTTTTTTTMTTTTTTTTTTMTTTTELVVDYEMKLDRSLVSSHKAVNSDVTGWIYIQGTVVDYPIIQSKDNDTYIHQDWQGNYSYSGCIYEDFRGDLDKTNLTILYGHNMANGSMFSTLRSYQSKEWGEQHRYIEVASETTRYLYEVFSVNVLYGESGASFTYWMPNQGSTLNLSKTDFQKYISQVRSTSMIWYGTDENPQYGDRILALQTCNSGNDDGMRCVVFAKCLGER